jgi:glycosyltransferase involved in cell wall biosynthesis
VTIAITTFRRPAFLLEAAESALQQDFDRPIEIIVIDNDPSSSSLNLLLERLPELRAANFRYFINAENIGMYGNVNRCIPLARGEWLTILHDDDMLAATFLTRAFRIINDDPSVAGIVCNKRLLNQRITDIPAHTPPYSTQLMSFRVLTALLAHGPEGWRALGKRLYQRYQKLCYDILFGRRASRRIKPDTFFWGPTLGNGSGFIFRKSAAAEMGGFYSEEFPASDLFFFARFASLFHLRHLRSEEAIYRIAQNESAKLETVLAALLWIHKLQLALAGRHVPRWWLRFAPLMLSRIMGEYLETWHILVPRRRVEEITGTSIPSDRPHLMFLIRALLRGL